MSDPHSFEALIERELRDAECVAREDDERMYIAAKGGPFWGVSLQEARDWLKWAVEQDSKMVAEQNADHDPGDEDR